MGAGAGDAGLKMAGADLAIIWKAARCAGLAAALVLLGQAAPSWGQAGAPYAAA